MQITRSRHLPDTHNHQLSELSSRPIEIEHEIEIEIRIGMEMEMEMQLEIAIRDSRFAIVIRIAIAANMQSILY